MSNFRSFFCFCLFRVAFVQNLSALVTSISLLFFDCFHACYIVHCLCVFYLLVPKVLCRLDCFVLLHLNLNFFAVSLLSVLLLTLQCLLLLAKFFKLLVILFSLIDTLFIVEFSLLLFSDLIINIVLPSILCFYHYFSFLFDCIMLLGGSFILKLGHRSPLIKDTIFCLWVVSFVS